MRVLKTVYAIDITEEESRQAYLAYLWSLNENGGLLRANRKNILDFSEHIRRDFGISGYRETNYVYLVIPSDRDTPEFRELVEAWAREFISSAIMQMKAAQGLMPFTQEKQS